MMKARRSQRATNLDPNSRVQTIGTPRVTNNDQNYNSDLSGMNYSSSSPSSSTSLTSSSASSSSFYYQPPVWTTRLWEEVCLLWTCVVLSPDCTGESRKQWRLKFIQWSRVNRCPRDESYSVPDHYFTSPICDPGRERIEDVPGQGQQNDILVSRPNRLSSVFCLPIEASFITWNHTWFVNLLSLSSASSLIPESNLKFNSNINKCDKLSTFTNAINDDCTHSDHNNNNNNNNNNNQFVFRRPSNHITPKRRSNRPQSPHSSPSLIASGGSPSRDCSCPYCDHEIWGPLHEPFPLLCLRVQALRSNGHLNQALQLAVYISQRLLYNVKQKSQFGANAMVRTPSSITPSWPPAHSYRGSVDSATTGAINHGNSVGSGMISTTTSSRTLFGTNGYRSHSGSRGYISNGDPSNMISSPLQPGASHGKYPSSHHHHHHHHPNRLSSPRPSSLSPPISVHVNRSGLRRHGLSPSSSSNPVQSLPQPAPSSPCSNSPNWFKSPLPGNHTFYQGNHYQHPHHHNPVSPMVYPKLSSPSSLPYTIPNSSTNPTHYRSLASPPPTHAMNGGLGCPNPVVSSPSSPNLATTSPHSSRDWFTECQTHCDTGWIGLPGRPLICLVECLLDAAAIVVEAASNQQQQPQQDQSKTPPLVIPLWGHMEKASFYLYLSIKISMLTLFQQRRLIGSSTSQLMACQHQETRLLSLLDTVPKDVSCAMAMCETLCHLLGPPLTQSQSLSKMERNVSWWWWWSSLGPLINSDSFPIHAVAQFVLDYLLDTQRLNPQFQSFNAVWKFAVGNVSTVRIQDMLFTLVTRAMRFPVLETISDNNGMLVSSSSNLSPTPVNNDLNATPNLSLTRSNSSPSLNSSYPGGIGGNYCHGTNSPSRHGGLLDQRNLFSYQHPYHYPNFNGPFNRTRRCSSHVQHHQLSYNSNNNNSNINHPLYHHHHLLNQHQLTNHPYNPLLCSLPTNASDPVPTLVQPSPTTTMLAVDTEVNDSELPSTPSSLSNLFDSCLSSPSYGTHLLNARPLPPPYPHPPPPPPSYLSNHFHRHPPVHHHPNHHHPFPNSPHFQYNLPVENNPISHPPLSSMFANSTQICLQSNGLHYPHFYSNPFFTNTGSPSSPPSSSPSSTSSSSSSSSSSESSSVIMGQTYPSTTPSSRRRTANDSLNDSYFSHPLTSSVHNNCNPLHANSQQFRCCLELLRMRQTRLAISLIKVSKSHIGRLDQIVQICNQYIHSPISLFAISQEIFAEAVGWKPARCLIGRKQDPNLLLFYSNGLISNLSDCYCLCSCPDCPECLLNPTLANTNANLPCYPPSCPNTVPSSSPSKSLPSDAKTTHPSQDANLHNRDRIHLISTSFYLALIVVLRTMTRSVHWRRREMLVWAVSLALHVGPSACLYLLNHWFVYMNPREAIGWLAPAMLTAMGTLDTNSNINKNNNNNSNNNGSNSNNNNNSNTTCFQSMAHHDHLTKLPMDKSTNQRNSNAKMCCSSSDQSLFLFGFPNWPHHINGGGSGGGGGGDSMINTPNPNLLDPDSNYSPWWRPSSTSASSPMWFGFYPASFVSQNQTNSIKMVAQLLGTAVPYSKTACEQITGALRLMAMQVASKDPVNCALAALNLCEKDSNTFDAVYRLVLQSAELGNLAPTQLYSLARYMDNRGGTRRAFPFALHATRLFVLTGTTTQEIHPISNDVLWACLLGLRLGPSALQEILSHVIRNIQCPNLLTDILHRLRSLPCGGSVLSTPPLNHHHHNHHNNNNNNINSGNNNSTDGMIATNHNTPNNNVNSGANGNNQSVGHLGGRGVVCSSNPSGINSTPNPHPPLASYTYHNNSNTHHHHHPPLPPPPHHVYGNSYLPKMMLSLDKAPLKGLLDAAINSFVIAIHTRLANISPRQYAEFVDFLAKARDTFHLLRSSPDGPMQFRSLVECLRQTYRGKRKLVSLLSERFG